MLEKIKKFFKKEKFVAKQIPEGMVSVVKEEITEIKDLNLSEVDQVQGEIIANIAVTAMASMGIPSSQTMREIIKIASAYAIRDFKEGSTNPEKLIVMRVLNKIKEIKEAKTKYY